MNVKDIASWTKIRRFTILGSCLISCLSMAASLDCASIFSHQPELDRSELNILGYSLHAGDRSYTTEQRTWIAQQLRLALEKISVRPSYGFPKDHPLRHTEFAGILNSQKALERALKLITLKENAQITDWNVEAYLKLQAFRPSDAALNSISHAQTYEELYKVFTHEASQAPYYGPENQFVRFSNFGGTQPITLVNRDVHEQLPEGLTASIAEALRTGKPYVENEAKPLLGLYALNRNMLWDVLIVDLNWQRAKIEKIPGKITFIEPIESAQDGNRGRIILDESKYGVKQKPYTEEQRISIYRAIRFHRSYQVIEN